MLRTAIAAALAFGLATPVVAAQDSAKDGGKADASTKDGGNPAPTAVQGFTVQALPPLQDGAYVWPGFLLISPPPPPPTPPKPAPQLGGDHAAGQPPPASPPPAPPAPKETGDKSVGGIKACYIVAPTKDRGASGFPAAGTGQITLVCTKAEWIGDTRP